MRARTIREGSVGLLILLGIGLFGGLVLWLRGFNPANRPYELIAEFEDVMGIQIGTPVMYRGVSVGRVTSINPKANSVDVGLEITAKELRMPNQVLVETVESGLIGEISVEISPLAELSDSAKDINPTGKGCDNNVILCDGDRLAGEAGPSYEALLRSFNELTQLYTDPELLAELKGLLSTVADASENAGDLASEATQLTRQVRSEILPLTNSARDAVDSAAIAALQVAGTAEQFSLTAAEINALIGENRGTLATTLDNVQSASLQLRGVADSLGPTFQSGELVGNLEVVLNNAAAASEDLQAITSSLNTPVNLVLLQQTLESARDALASAQKVMADVDEITGDPEVREQIRNLINGLGGLVSSTQLLEQQSEVARTLEPLNSIAESLPAGSAEYGLGSFADENLALDENFSHENFSYENLDYENLSNAGSDSSETTLPLALSDLDPNQQRPVLVFDGERYILQSAEQLAERPSQRALPRSAEALPSKGEK